MDIVKALRVNWDRVAAVACALLGGLCLLGGWLGASDALYPAEQIPYFISGGLGGLLLVAVAATLWLSADLRDEWRHLDGLEQRLTARIDAAVGDALKAPRPEAATPARPRRGKRAS